MSVRAVIGKVVRQGRLIINGVGKKKPGYVKTETQPGDSCKAPQCFLHARSARLHQQQGSFPAQSLIARNLQSCTFRSLAAELRRQAAVRLSGSLYGQGLPWAQLARTRLPLLSFVTLGFVSHQSQQEEPDFDAISQNIKNIFEEKSPPGLENDQPSTEEEKKLSHYELGPMIGIGCNAAVHLAKNKQENINSEDDSDESENEEDVILDESLEDSESSETAEEDSNVTIEQKDDFDLAIKMMFNYDTESDAGAIWQVMQHELLPVQHLQDFGEMGIWQNGTHVKKKRLKQHPNIVKMDEAFVDNVPDLPEGCDNYPLALPSRINPGGYGRNKTMFAVMKRYDMTLEEYLKHNKLGWFEATCLLTQLVESVVHLNNEGIAHRDLKSNNILLDLNKGQVPHLVLTDFGSSYDAASYGWSLRYENDQINRGGNPCLMAPEISCALPGPGSYLDYSKADLWAVGAIAYEIFGGKNPFYTNSDNTIQSATYREGDLPAMTEDVPAEIQEVIKMMLTRDPQQRPCAVEVANILHFLLWWPREWFCHRDLPSKVEVMHWLLLLTTEVMLERSLTVSSRSTCQLKESFLKRLQLNQLFTSIQHFYNHLYDVMTP